jgi:hypothetical protein
MFTRRYVRVRFNALRSLERPTKMSEQDATIRDLERTVDELRRDRDEWRDLTERALAQIEQWKNICERWEKRYNDMMARMN